MKSTTIFKKRRYLLLNEVKPLFAPVIGPHLGHYHDQLDHTQCFSQHSVFFGLTFLLKTRLELSLFGRDDQNSHICLTGSHDHVGHIVFMSRSIEKSKSFVFQEKVHLSILSGFSINSLFRNDVRDSCIFPSFHLVLFDFSLVPCQFLLINLF